MSDGPVERGPNYDWKHEALHYREECDSLRRLLTTVERSSDRRFEENRKLREALKAVVSVADRKTKEFDMAREALNADGDSDGR